MSKPKTPWTLYIDQGSGPTKHAEKSGPEPLKAVARQLHELAKQPDQITYLIYDPSGRLQYKSTHNTIWRMRWKRTNGQVNTGQLVA
jgi:hypothetical protein